jgi:hypothetical protein
MRSYFNRLIHVVPLTPTRHLTVSDCTFLVVTVCILVHKWRKISESVSHRLRQGARKSTGIKILVSGPFGSSGRLEGPHTHARLPYQATPSLGSTSCQADECLRVQVPSDRVLRASRERGVPSVNRSHVGTGMSLERRKFAEPECAP